MRNIFLWIHQSLTSPLSPPWFTSQRDIEVSDQIPHPLWVMIKFPPSRARKGIKYPGYARGDVEASIWLVHKLKKIAILSRNRVWILIYQMWPILNGQVKNCYPKLVSTDNKDGCLWLVTEECSALAMARSFLKPGLALSKKLKFV